MEGLIKWHFFDCRNSGLCKLQFWQSNYFKWVSRHLNLRCNHLNCQIIIAEKTKFLGKLFLKKKLLNVEYYYEDCTLNKHRHTCREAFPVSLRPDNPTSFLFFLFEDFFGEKNWMLVLLQVPRLDNLLMFTLLWTYCLILLQYWGWVEVEQDLTLQ